MTETLVRKCGECGDPVASLLDLPDETRDAFPLGRAWVYRQEPCGHILRMNESFREDTGESAGRPSTVDLLPLGTSATDVDAALAVLARLRRLTSEGSDLDAAIVLTAHAIIDQVYGRGEGT